MSELKKVLLTGGAGYIGSHTAVALRAAGFEPVLLDNFANSHPAVLGRLQQITGGAPVVCERVDVRETAAVAEALRRHQPVGVVHFAGDKAVGESAAQPLKYFENNVGGAVSLLQAMEAVYFKPAPDGTANGNALAWQGTPPTIVFSSTATVYGEPDEVPVPETAKLETHSPYAHTKLVIEQMLAAVRAARPAWRVGVLRYFNPVGAHESGLIGEDPAGIPNNLMPFVQQVAVGRQPRLRVFGNDYPTRDGTGVRDYLHVMDLAEGHVAALQKLLTGAEGDATTGETGNPSFTVNLGTGRGQSVLEVVKAFEAASGRPIPYDVHPRRAGDVAEYYANPALAKTLLGWEARRSLADMCADAWRWASQNPKGYAGDE